MASVGSIGSISPLSIQGMDLETALMAVQTNRANLLETQLKDQIAAVQAKNDQIAKLNQLLGALNKIAASMPSDAKAGDKVDLSKGGTDIAALAADAGLTLPDEFKPPTWEVTLRDGTKHTVDAAGKAEADVCVAKYWAFRSNDYSGAKAVVKIEPKGGKETTKGDLDGYIQQMKSTIDSLSNSQQMDMLRLQSLSNKRNEAFDLMTNFIKKMQDSRSSIVGNMR